MKTETRKPKLKNTINVFRTIMNAIESCKEYSQLLVCAKQIGVWHRKGIEQDKYFQIIQAFCSKSNQLIFKRK